MFETAIPVLQVRRSVAAVEFYCRGLGFTLLYSWPSDTQRDPRYLTLVRDRARLHVHSFQVAGVGAAAVYVGFQIDYGRNCQRYGGTYAAGARGKFTSIGSETFHHCRRL